MTDDMGYADLGSYGGKDIKTPNLDRLARDGVRLTDAYANGVLCSPTRAALISGRYPQRGAIETALGPEGTRGLAVSGSSLPQLLKNGGYRTGLIGKWHLGGTVTGGGEERRPTRARVRPFLRPDGQPRGLLASQSRARVRGSLGRRDEDLDGPASI